MRALLLTFGGLLLLNSVSFGDLTSPSYPIEPNTNSTLARYVGAFMVPDAFPSGITWDTLHGRLLVGDSNAPVIYAMSPIGQMLDTIQLESFDMSDCCGGGLAAQSDGTLLVVEPSNDVIRYTSDGQRIGTLLHLDIEDADGIAWSPQTGAVYAIDDGHYLNEFRINPANHLYLPVGNYLGRSENAVAVDLATGNLLVASGEDKLIEVTHENELIRIMSLDVADELLRSLATFKTRLTAYDSESRLLYAMSWEPGVMAVFAVAQVPEPATRFAAIWLITAMVVRRSRR